jgi:lipopolysaccharide assembly outer membrane protein LptD (OstA)
MLLCARTFSHLPSVLKHTLQHSIDLPPGDSALQIRATHYALTRTPEGELFIELLGKVRIEYQGRRLEGERLLLDTDAGLVRSEEPFSLVAALGVLSGQRGEYRYEQGRGRFEGVQATVLGIYLDAVLLEGDLRDFTAQEVVVSTCDPFRSPIRVRAERVRLVRGARLTLRNTRLFLYGQPLPNLPQLTVRVGETAEVASLPAPVYSAETGWGARATGVADRRERAAAGVRCELPARGSRNARGGRYRIARRRAYAGRP